MDIFVINLDRREDRWREMRAQLDALGLAYQRVRAVDGAGIADDGRLPIPRVYEANWQSHVAAFALAAQCAGLNSLILEDDAVFAPDIDWPALLEQLDSYMTDARIDVLQVGWVGNFETGGIRGALRTALQWLQQLGKGRSTKLFGSPEEGRAPFGMELIAGEFKGGAHCYLISRRAAGAFLGLNSPPYLCIDEFFEALAASQLSYGRYRVARLRRNLAVQKSRISGAVIDSDLEHSLPECSRAK